MKKAFVLAMLFLFIGQAFAQNKKSKSKRMETTEHYTFKLSDKVTRQKVSFKNRYGIILSGDLYLPKNTENAKFSAICHEYGIKFIGATAEQINGMGDKASAKETMKKAGVPTIPGSEGLLTDVKEGIKLANENEITVYISRLADKDKVIKYITENTKFKNYDLISEDYSFDEFYNWYDYFVETESYCNVYKFY